MEMSNEIVVQNLMEAGLTEKQIEESIYLFEKKEYLQAFFHLRNVRCGLLDNMHDSQKKLDKLDFLLYNLKKKVEEK